jgi:hypothetical protein
VSARLADDELLITRTFDAPASHPCQFPTWDCTAAAPAPPRAPEKSCPQTRRPAG